MLCWACIATRIPSFGVLEFIGNSPCCKITHHYGEFQVKEYESTNIL